MTEGEERGAWWRLEDGWQRIGRHTPHRRCGYCKADIAEALTRDRGACLDCLRTLKLDGRSA